MADDVSARKAHVQSLRTAARACCVPLVRDDVGRDRVTKFAAAIRNSAGPANQKTAADVAFQAYEKTWQVPQATEAPKKGGWRLRGRSFLLTYNWDFLGLPFPDGTPAATTPGQLWRLWKAWKEQKKAAQKVQQSTSTLEAWGGGCTKVDTSAGTPPLPLLPPRPPCLGRCPPLPAGADQQTTQTEGAHLRANKHTPLQESLLSALEGRLHFHWKVNCEEPLDEPTTACFAFHGVLPDARATFVTAATKQARGANQAEASNRGHFYTWAPKRGTLKVGTNWKPWEKYRVLGKWLDDLWTDGKLDHSAYLALSLRVRVGVSGRKRDLEVLLAEEREARVNCQMAEVEVELAKLRAPFLTFPAVKEWEDSFLTLSFRWKLLLLVADSASGKSSFAESLFDNPYVLTVEDAENLDLKGFDKDVHDGLVLDNVNSWQQLLNWRAVLQARNAKSRGGQSATNVYSYVQYLFGVPVVATVDFDAPDAHLADSTQEGHSKWLAKNGVFVKLKAGEAFYDRDKLPPLQLENRFSLFAATLKRRRGL